MTRPWLVAAALAASAALLPLAVGAQAPSDEAPPPYRPSLADLMSTTVQPRHIKLAFAGREKNWAFAAYEVKQLANPRRERSQRYVADNDEPKDQNR